MNSRTQEYNISEVAKQNTKSYYTTGRGKESIRYLIISSWNWQQKTDFLGEIHWLDNGSYDAPELSTKRKKEKRIVKERKCNVCHVESQEARRSIPFSVW